MVRTSLAWMPLSSSRLSVLGKPLVFSRAARNQAFDADFDQDELAEARKWYSSFNGDDLPKGQTSYARSSGPGGQHVNKYDIHAQDKDSC